MIIIWYQWEAQRQYPSSSIKMHMNSPKEHNMCGLLHVSQLYIWILFPNTGDDLLPQHGNLQHV